MSSFWEKKKVLVTGGSGFLGSYVVQKLRERGVEPENLRIPRSRDMDLALRKNCVDAVSGMDVVIHLAARVGGIGFNRLHPAELFYENAIMGIQLLEAARIERVEKYLQAGTVCSYPKFCPIPFTEENLWNGYPEETNAPYGIAKKMLIVQSQAYRAQYGLDSINLICANLYGPRDNFDPARSHVIPALMAKFVTAVEEGLEEVTVWGTGQASREFLYVEDCAEAIVLAAERYHKPMPVNIGSGQEVKISELVALLAELTGFQGKIIWDSTKPDGQPRRMLDISRAEAEFGFRATTDLATGLRNTLEWFRRNRTVIGSSGNRHLLRNEARPT